MWNKGHIVYVDIKTPKIKWLKLFLPIYVIHEIIESFIDIATLGAFLAPNVAMGHQAISFKYLSHILLSLRSSLNDLYIEEKKDILNIHIGSQDLSFKVKIL